MNCTDKIKFRGEISTERKNKLSCVVLLGGIVLCVILMVLVPTMEEYRSVTAPNCVSEPGCFELENGNAVWRAHFNNIDVLNQAISVFFDSESSEELNLHFRFSLSILGVDSETATEGYEIDTKTTGCNTGCYVYDISYLPIIEYNYYVVKVTILNPIPPQIPSISISFGFIREDFTTYQLAVKYFFLCLSVVSLVVYLLNVLTVPFSKWPLDSKLTAMLSVSLVLFNEPFFAMNIYEPSEAIFFFSSICIYQFAFVSFGCRFISNLIYKKEKKKSCRKVAFFILDGIYLTIFSAMLLLLHIVIGKNRYDFRYDLNDNASFCFVCYLMLFALRICIFSFLVVQNQDDHANKCGGNYILLALLNFGLCFPIPGSGLKYELFFDSISNLWVFVLAFYYAPRQVSPILIQEFKRPGEETEDNPEDNNISRP